MLQTICLRLSVLIPLLLVVGCGGETPPPVGTVAGTISFGKQPTSPIELMIVSTATGRGANAAIEAGSFVFTEPLLVGSYTAYLAPQSQPDATAAFAVTLDKAVPEIYWNEIQSPMKVEVAEGENLISLEVKN